MFFSGWRVEPEELNYIQPTGLATPDSMLRSGPSSIQQIKHDAEGGMGPRGMQVPSPLHHLSNPNTAFHYLHFVHFKHYHNGLTPLTFRKAKGKKQLPILLYTHINILKFIKLTTFKMMLLENHAINSSSRPTLVKKNVPSATTKYTAVDYSVKTPPLTISV